MCTEQHCRALSAGNRQLIVLEPSCHKRKQLLSIAVTVRRVSDCHAASLIGCARMYEASDCRHARCKVALCSAAGLGWAARAPPLSARKHGAMHAPSEGGRCGAAEQATKG
jgi:hypothetical protein